MVRSLLLVAIAVIGSAIDASAQDALSEALYGYRHDTSETEGIPTAVMPLAFPALVVGEPPCDGLPVEGEFVLDRDIACSVTLGTDATLDLNGFTLEGTVFAGENATIKNGTVLRGSVSVQGECDFCTIDSVRVIDAPAPFAVQPGGGSRITNSFFSGNHVAIDLFHGGGSTVIENSTFENNAVGVSIQKDNSNTISSNRFRSNTVGVRLYNELHTRVSYNTISDNDFTENDLGVAFTVSACFSAGCMNDNRVAGNRFVGNGGSGVLFNGMSFDAHCSQYPEECPEFDTSIDNNIFSGNGFSTSYVSVYDDGITVVDAPLAADRLTIADNVATSNSDLGIEAPDVIDGGGNRASGNGNPLECVGVVCTPIEQCADAIDNDGDGITDLDDPGCADAADLDEHDPTLPCDDGVDNDGDGKADFLAAGGGDLGCASPTSPRENPKCQDGLNNDFQPGIDFDGGDSLDIDPRDGFIDAQFNPAMPVVGAADPQCVGMPWGTKEQSGGCGLGAELVLVMPLLGLVASRRRRAN